MGLAVWNAASRSVSTTTPIAPARKASARNVDRMRSARSGQSSGRIIRARNVPNSGQTGIVLIVQARNGQSTGQRTGQIGLNARTVPTGLKDPISRVRTDPIVPSALSDPIALKDPMVTDRIGRDGTGLTITTGLIVLTGTAQTGRTRIARIGIVPVARTPIARTGPIAQATGTGIATIASSTTAGTATSGVVIGTVATAATGGVMTRAFVAGAEHGSVSISRRATATTACRAPIGTDSMLSANICRMSSGVIR